MFRRKLPTVLAALLSGVLSATAARSEVRFGNNVFIGGHDVSNQTFDSHRRGEYYVHDGRPSHPGCVWRGNADGSRTKVCHFQRK
jgi:hypothetical protein